MFPKTIDRTPERPSTTSRGCQHAVCEQTTREGKPYCPDHVESHPYVRDILDTLAARHAEEDAVRTVGAEAVNLSGLTARELLLHLSLHGARTVERLSRELQLDSQVLKGYVSALVGDGRVELGRTHRGSTIVKLSGE
jgi:hypothetical protein